MNDHECHFLHSYLHLKKSAIDGHYNTILPSKRQQNRTLPETLLHGTSIIKSDNGRLYQPYQHRRWLPCGKTKHLGLFERECRSTLCQRPIPVPSVYVDERGEIHNLQVGGKRINLLSTKKGVMRSGDIHENVQRDFVFSGKVEVWILKTDGTTEKAIYTSNSYLEIPPFVPHIFHFLEDTIMAEWWEPQGFYAWFYEPYRKLVQDSFQRTKPGHFRLLKPADDDKQRYDNYYLACILCSGLALGATL